jgi:RNA polymerase sigma factor (sigma-70 family)
MGPPADAASDQQPLETASVGLLPPGPTLSASLDVLFRAQAPLLLRFLSRKTVGREDAMDLIQESFLRMAKLSCSSPVLLKPEAYLQRILGNLLRDRARRAVTRAEHLHVPLDEETLYSRELDPEAALQTLELTERYHAALRGLSLKTRTVFLRHRLDGLTYAQIAEELNQSVSNIEKHMMRAIAHFDRVLGRPE